MVTGHDIRTGTEPEVIFYNALRRQGLKDGPDFTFQGRELGGRAEKGGLVLDFVFTNPPRLNVNINGVYWHYRFGSETIQRDIIAREVLAAQGDTLIFVDEDDLSVDPDFYTKEALAFRDHSKIARGW